MKPMDISFSSVSKVSHMAIRGRFTSTAMRESVSNATRESIIAEKKTSHKEFLSRILKHQYFDDFMYLITLLSMIMSAEDTPLIDPLSSMIRWVNRIEKAISLIYILEFVLKTWIFGLFKNRSSYFQESLLNYMEFFNIIISFLLLIDIQTSNRTLQILKSIRAFRIIKLTIFSNKELNIIGDCMLNSSVYVLKLLFFYGIWVFSFSLFAMKALKGSLFKCESLDLVEFTIVTMQDCFDWGGDWINSDTPYDNIFISFFTLFEISSSEGWSLIMLV